MTWSIEEIFKEEVIERSEKTDAGYSVWLKDIPVEIRIELSNNPTRGGYNFYISHLIFTPRQPGPYRPVRTWGDSEADALHLALASIIPYYKEALSSDLIPSAEWLVPNPRGY